MRHAEAARSNSEACVSCEARDRSEAHTKAVKEVEARQRRHTLRRCACHSVRLCFDGLCAWVLVLLNWESHALCRAQQIAHTLIHTRRTLLPIVSNKSGTFNAEAHYLKILMMILKSQFPYLSFF